MGRSRDSGFEFSSRAPKVKKRRAPARRNSIDVKLERHNERRMRLARVSEEEEEEHHVKRGFWFIRVRRQGKLVTPVVRYLKRFRRSCTSIATLAAAPFRCYKLDVLLAKLHLSRRRSSRKIHSLLTTTSSPSEEHAPLLPRLCDPLEA